MDGKNYTEVLIGGKIYTLGGFEEELYIQKVASYISDKMALLKKQEGYAKQSQENQSVMLELNIADDYFKAKEDAELAKLQKDSMERESYSLKHELVTAQMKLEQVEKETESLKQELERIKQELETAKTKTQQNRNTPQNKN